ncbi:hypothetical protein SAMN04244576_04440 [Sinorhizobium meliloti]|nr:hypothetical protein SAMN04244576_04440 [Sinorhizobium meliloti]
MSPVLNLASRSAPLFSLLPLTLTLSPRAGRGDAVVFDRTRQRAHGISSPLPASGRAVRENSCIAEDHLVWDGPGFWSAWIDLRRLVDFGDAFALEQALGDEVGEAQDR